MGKLITFDLCAALVVVTLMVIYLVQNGFPTKTGRIFLTLLHVTLVLAFADFATYYITFVTPQADEAVKYLIHIPCLMCYILLDITFFFYIKSITKGELIGKTDNYIFIAIGSVMTIAAISSPFTHLFCDLSTPGVYVRGPMYPISGLIVVFQIAYEVLLVYKYKRHMRPLQIAALAGGLAALVVSVIIQSRLPYLQIIAFATAIMMILIYAALESPSMYLFENSRCFNEKAFYSIMSDIISKPGHVNILLYRIEGYEYISHMVNEAPATEFRNSITRFFQLMYKRRNVFCLGNDLYAILTVKNVGQEVDAAIAMFPDQFTVDGVQFTAGIRAMGIVVGDFNSVAEIRQLITYARQARPEGDSKRIRLLTRSVLEERTRELEILQKVRAAVEQRSFEVYYQPIYEEKSGRFKTAEALIRLKDKDNPGQFIPPSVFIPLAEQNGLIIPIGEFVFEEVCRFYMAEKLEEKGVNFIEINLSPVQCAQRNLTLKLQMIMRKYNISPKHINLEITETAASSNKYTMTRNINALLEEGISFALDDFGTGHANIDHLSEMPVSIVKFDKQMLDKAMEDERSRTILESLIRLLKGLNYQCVVEGVENEEMLDMVRKLGCDYYQGYLFSKPVPQDEYIRFLQNN